MNDNSNDRNPIAIDSKSIEYDLNENQSRSKSDSTVSDIGFKNKMALAWTTLKDKSIHSFFQAHKLVRFCPNRPWVPPLKRVIEKMKTE